MSYSELAMRSSDLAPAIKLAPHGSNLQSCFSAIPYGERYKARCEAHIRQSSRSIISEVKNCRSIRPVR